MYRQALAVSVGLCIFAPIAQPQAGSPAWTADQLVQAALTKNRDFLSVQQRIREAQGLLTQAGVGITDNLEVTGVTGQAFGKAGEDNFSATYSHTFEIFGKRGRRVEVARMEIALAQAELDERHRTLAFEIKTRYADAAAEQLKLALVERLLRVNQDYLRLTEARVQKGDVAQLEADLLRVELNRDQSRRALAEGRVSSALLQLRAVIDATPAENLSIATSLSVPAIPDDLHALQALALRSRPDLRLLQVGLEQAQAQLALAKVEAKPNLTLSGQYSHADSAFDQFGLNPVGTLTPIRDHVNSVGVGLSIPLTTARRNRGNIEVATARQAGAQLRSDYSRNVIPTQVEAAYQRWRSAREAAAIFDHGVIDQSEKNLDVMRRAYNLGELRLLDILNEQRRLLDTELSYIDTQADLFRAYAELEQAAGGSLQ